MVIDETNELIGGLLFGRSAKLQVVENSIVFIGLDSMEVITFQVLNNPYSVIVKINE